jgi:hypothetical protein
MVPNAASVFVLKREYNKEKRGNWRKDVRSRARRAGMSDSAAA